MPGSTLARGLWRPHLLDLIGIYCGGARSPQGRQIRTREGVCLAVGLTVEMDLVLKFHSFNVLLSTYYDPNTGDIAINKTDKNSFF